MLPVSTLNAWAAAQREAQRQQPFQLRRNTLDLISAHLGQCYAL